MAPIRWSTGARRDDTLYAVKMIARRDDDAGGDQDAVKFRREAAQLACIEHPDLVRVHDVGEVAGYSYGGEEFAVLLPETPPERGTALADRLCESIRGTSVPTAAGPLTVTVSVGLAGLQGDNNVHALLKHADEALYVAKRSGRHQGVVATAT